MVSLCEDPFRVVVPAGWPEPHSYADLADRPWISGPLSSASGQALERLAGNRGFAPRRVHTCVDYPALLALVGAGLGAAIAPGLALRGVDRTAVRVTDLPGAAARRLDALLTVGRAHRPAVEALLGALHQVIRAGAS